MTPLASPRHVSARPPARRLSPGDHAMLRACIRPVFADAQSASLRENHLSRHLGLSPQGHRNSNRPPRGGAGSARPRGTLALDRGMCPLGPQPLAKSSVMMTRVGLRPASLCEKVACLMSSLSLLGDPRCAWPPRKAILLIFPSMAKRFSPISQ